MPGCSVKKKEEEEVEVAAGKRNIKYSTVKSFFVCNQTDLKLGMEGEMEVESSRPS